jgi:uncharacterized protein (DUF885 family)
MPRRKTIKNLMRIILQLTFFLLFSALFAQNNQKLNKVIDDLREIEKSFEKERLIANGQHPESFPVATIEEWIEEADAVRGKLKELEAIPSSGLSSEDLINKEIRILQLRDQLSWVDFKMYLIPMNAEGGSHLEPTFFLNRLPFETVNDYDAYLKWLPSYVKSLQFQQTLLEQGLMEGILAPKVIVANNLKLLEPWVKDAPNHAFYSPILKLPSSISASDQLRIQKQALTIIEGEIIPAYKTFYQFLEKKYLPKAPAKVGISEIKNGRAYYENRVRHFTTLDMSPDSVFNLGMQEVERIRSQMEAVMKSVNYPGSFADFLQFLRTDPQFYAKTSQELLSRAAWLSKRAEGELPKLFAKLYELPFTVAPVPDAIAPTYTGGRYVPGSRAQNNPGTYWVNTYNLPSRPLYTLPSLTLHEAVPGHHLQIMMAAELTGLPDFRNNYYISAFGEGWGLYSEYLGEEMGLYETPYELFGRYTYEMWRACRLVVDPGIHYKGWTRAQAVEFMASNTALSLHEVNTEIDRYIGWPGQAVSYKIGELTIKRLRRQAEERLGNKFDIQKFHDAVLKNGSVPLNVLSQEINGFIEKAGQ